MGDVLALPRDRALGGFALVDIEQAGHGPNGGGLAGTVGTQEGDDVAFGHFDGQAAQDEDHFVVDDLEIRDFEQETFLVRAGMRVGGMTIDRRGDTRVPPRSSIRSHDVERRDPNRFRHRKP